jgi:hypothetical protein
VGRVRSHCRVILPLIYFIPDVLAYSVPLFLKRQCDRTQGRPRLRRVQGQGQPGACGGRQRVPHDLSGPARGG